ncbi:hypothetical protein [Streptomyces xantholiticus]|uniref:hypothetical protein n=1 Tax=Streptomyces xantholiticus TaxID=68285 RepID=UPI003D9F0694
MASLRAAADRGTVAGEGHRARAGWWESDRLATEQDRAAAQFVHEDRGAAAVAQGVGKPLFGDDDRGDEPAQQFVRAVGDRRCARSDGSCEVRSCPRRSSGAGGGHVLRGRGRVLLRPPRQACVERCPHHPEPCTARGLLLPDSSEHLEKAPSTRRIRQSVERSQDGHGRLPSAVT